MSKWLSFSKSQYMDRLSRPLTDSFEHAAANDNGAKPSRESEASKQARREMGDKIGELAKEYFSGGIETTAHYTDIEGSEAETTDLIKAGEELIFEATAINPKDGSHCRIDVLRKVPGKEMWDMIEVKSSTKVKPEHIQDLAFQRHVFEGAGYKIRNSYLMHVNTDYVAGPDIDPQQLFNVQDVTRRVKTKQKYVAPKLRELIAHKTAQQYVDQDALKNFVKKIEYPVYYLDYETVMSAIPLYEGTTPYQQVPFQFSLHIQEKPGGPLTHVSFLHKEATDPRRDFAEALVNCCGDKGSVIVYFQPFESGRNEELAKDFPEFAADLKAINDRMVDIFEPFQQRWLYDPVQEGSASLKTVLPTFTNISYDNMEIGNGEQALQEYLAFVAGTKTDPVELQQLWDGLEEYCGQDTYAMVELLTVLNLYAHGPGPDPVPLPKTGPKLP